VCVCVYPSPVAKAVALGGVDVADGGHGDETTGERSGRMREAARQRDKIGRLLAVDYYQKVSIFKHHKHINVLWPRFGRKFFYFGLLLCSVTLLAIDRKRTRHSCNYSFQFRGGDDDDDDKFRIYKRSTILFLYLLRDRSHVCSQSTVTTISLFIQLAMAVGLFTCAFTFLRFRQAIRTKSQE